MDEVLKTISEQWEDMTGQVMEANDEALDEIRGIWSNTSMSQFNFTSEGVQAMFTEARTEMAKEYSAFTAAVDWEDTWITGLLAFHGTLWVVLILSWFVGVGPNFKIGFFTLIAALCGSGSFLNSAAADNWEAFSGQNYFDERGVFMSVMWSVPLLVLLFVVLMTILIDLCKMMVAVKVSQIKAKARKAKSREPSVKSAESKKKD